MSALRGFGVSLEPLVPAHLDELVGVGDDVVWRYPPMAPGPLPRTADEHRAWWTRWFALAERAIANGEEVFCVRRDLDGALVGSTRYLNVAVAHRRREIGGTFYRADARGNAVNPACKRLLFAYAFDELACVRVELKCDARNLASRAAIAKLGAREEGIFRRHLVLGDGHIRDTVYFSILDSEWPEVRSRLDERLKSAP